MDGTVSGMGEHKMNGFIKLNRSILDWEWWDDLNTFRLFMTILLLANWKDKRWHGKLIPRGSLWTSIDSLAKKSGLTKQQTRTSLNKLISTGEITSESTNEGRLVTVENYDVYQAVDFGVTNELTNELTNDQQTSNKRPNKRVTTTEEYIRIKERKKGKKLDPSDPDYFSKLVEMEEL